MNLILNRYLLEHHRLDLPGLGTIRLERVPANYDFGAGQLNSPSFISRFSTDAVEENAHFDSYLSAALSVPKDQARSHFQTYLGEIRSELEGKGVWSALPIGQLKRSANGELQFESAQDSLWTPSPVAVSRIIRSTQAPTEISTVEELPAATDRWWIAAIVIAVLALTMILAGYLQSNSWLFNP